MSDYYDDDVYQDYIDRMGEDSLMGRVRRGLYQLRHGRSYWDDMSGEDDDETFEEYEEAEEAGGMYAGLGSADWEEDEAEEEEDDDW